MTFYYATLADALSAVMTYGIRPAERREIVPIATTPELAERVAMAQYDTRDKIFVYSINVPDGERLEPIRENEFYGYAGSIPAEWIDREYLITSEEAET